MNDAKEIDQSEEPAPTKISFQVCGQSKAKFCDIFHTKLNFREFYVGLVGALSLNETEICIL